MMKYLLKLLLLCICCFCVQNIQAQKYDIENFSMEEGLPSSQLYNIVQDDNGYLWFSTDNGITRYDGYEFKNYDTKNGLPSDVVLRFFPQENNHVLWGATSTAELFFFDTDNYKIHQYKFNSVIKPVIDKWSINSLYIDSEKSLYLGFYYASGYLKIDSAGTVFNYMRLPDRSEANPDTSYTYYLINAVEKGRWYEPSFCITEYDDPILLKERLSNFDIQVFKSINDSIFNKYERVILKSRRDGDKTIYTDKHGFGFKNKDTTWAKKTKQAPLAAGFYRNETLWVGYKDAGLKLYSENGRLIETYLPEKSVTDLCVDKEGGVWISTLESGVFYIHNPAFVKKRTVEKEGVVVNIFNVPNDKLYIQYQNGATYAYEQGVNTMYMPKNVKHHAKHLVYSTHKKSLLKFRTGLGKMTINDTLTINSGKKGVVTHVMTNNAFEDVMFVGHFGFGVYNNHNSYRWYDLGKIVRSVWQYNNGWYVGTTEGMYYYSVDKKLTPMSSIDSLFSYSIDDITGSSEYILAAARGAGILVFNKDTIFNISKEEGLYSSKVRRIYKQNDSTYLVITYEGLNRLSFSKNFGNYFITGVNKSDGLLSNEIRDVAVVGDSIWVATPKGINTFPISLIEENKVTNLYLRIISTYINDSLVGSEELNKLSYSQNRLKVSFNAIAFGKNEYLEYRYQIKELENKWNYTKSRTANYPSLLPGSYTFIVQASDNGKEFIEQASFEFTILQPYYATWWFKALVLVAISVLVYLFFRVRILTYNKDIIRELLRHFLKWIRRNQKYIIIKSQGKNIKLITSDIYYIKSSGNYIEIYTTGGIHLVRAKIGEFIEDLPDQIEFLRVHRSYIIRLDKIEQHDSNTVVVKGEEIPIGSRYKTNYLKSVF